MRRGTKRNEKRNAKDEIWGYERNREDETQTEAEVQGRQAAVEQQSVREAETSNTTTKYRSQHTHMATSYFLLIYLIIDRGQ